MAHISIIDISKTEGFIEFKFKTEFDSNFRRGVGDCLHLGEYYRNFLIKSNNCPEITGSCTIFVEGFTQVRDNDRLFADYTNFLGINTAVHIFNSGIITNVSGNRNSEPDEWGYNDFVEDAYDEY